MGNRILFMILVVFVCSADAYCQPHRDKKVRDDKAKIANDVNWYYDDLAAGISAAEKSGKPLMVVLRCIP